jgi:hypothetical protein
LSPLFADPELLLLLSEFFLAYTTEADKVSIGIVAPDSKSKRCVAMTVVTAMATMPIVLDNLCYLHQ